MRCGYCYGSNEAHCAHWWGKGGTCCHCQETGVQSLARQTPDEPGKPGPRNKITPCR